MLLCFDNSEKHRWLLSQIRTIWSYLVNILFVPKVLTYLPQKFQLIFPTFLLLQPEKGKRTITTLALLCCWSHFQSSSAACKTDIKHKRVQHRWTPGLWGITLSFSAIHIQTGHSREHSGENSSHLYWCLSPLKSWPNRANQGQRSHVQNILKQ